MLFGMVKIMPRVVDPGCFYFMIPGKKAELSTAFYSKEQPFLTGECLEIGIGFECAQTE